MPMLILPKTIIMGGGFVTPFCPKYMRSVGGSLTPRKKVLFWRVWIPNFAIQYPEKNLRPFEVNFAYPPKT